MKNPRDLTPEQRGSLASLSKTNSGLYRAYLLKEQLRLVFSTKGETGRELLAGWLAWARRSQLPGFVTLAATIKRFQQLIFKHPRSRPVQCTLGSHEHAPTSTDQTRQRIPHTRSLHRHGHAHPRRLCPALPNRP